MDCSELYGDPEQVEEVFKIKKVVNRTGIPHQIFFVGPGNTLSLGELIAVGANIIGSATITGQTLNLTNNIAQSLNLVTNQTRLSEIITSFILTELSNDPQEPEGTKLGDMRVRFWSSTNPLSFQLVKEILIPLNTAVIGSYHHKIVTYNDLVDLTDMCLITSWEWIPIIDVGDVRIINLSTTAVFI